MHHFAKQSTNHNLELLWRKVISKKIQLPVTLFFGNRLPFVYAKQL
jgi:hypothetical protein